MRNTVKLYRCLAPFSFLYGIGVRIRNFLFDAGIFRSECFSLPVICVGNLAVGGTGKTPHTEYLIRLLRGRYRVAVLSRGYKRKTSGFVLADETSTGETIGDEPYQMKRKFSDILVAVDADRRRGIRRLLALPEGERPEVLLLDDAFQHRHVRASLNILLTDSHRLYAWDRLLPEGRLREPTRGAGRAEVVIVTKCDHSLSPADYREMEKVLDLYKRQELFFSTIRYGELTPLFPDEAPSRSLRGLAPDEEALLLSGIASPRLFEEEVRRYTGRTVSLSFPDHHAFDRRDIGRIGEAFGRLSSPGKLIITTEKDAARLRDVSFLPMEWRSRLYYLPIEVEFLQEGEERFREMILKHIHDKLKNLKT